jgi:hypothetical protein
MTPTRTLDALLAAAVALAMVSFVLFKGDALYLGLWYYLAVPIAVLSICAAFRLAPYFLFGTASAIAISMLAVMSINWRASRPEGLLGLGHVFSLPGALVGAMAVAFVARKLRIANPLVAFLFGLAGFGVGYFFNQILVCNTVMWCGPLSLPIK